MASDRKETVREEHGGDQSKAGKKPKKLIWQSPKGPNAKVTLVTLHDENVETHRLNAYAEIKPNQAGQYVLASNAKEYAKQLEAMESYVEKYGLYPVDAKMEGVLPTSYEGMELPENSAEAVSTLKAELMRAQKENAELIRKLAELENDKPDADKK